MDPTEIDQRLRAVLDRLAAELSFTERQEIEQFVEIGEPSVALDALSSLIIEQSKPLSAAVFEEMDALSGAVGCRSTTITDPLRRQIER